jgi:hypothetical protein
MNDVKESPYGSDTPHGGTCRPFYQAHGSTPVWLHNATLGHLEL